MTAKELTEFQHRLLSWFEQEQRPLPWRQKYDPYEIWISEIMLQQTQVRTVLPYYQRWMQVLPNLEAVAEASENVILKLWEGLGYYSRARNIHKTAKILVAQYQAQFPGEPHQLLELPGIGRYTAGAILSIAFNQKPPIVDGNVTRILCRIMDYRELPTSAPMQKRLWALAEAWIPEQQARWFNQAMMELGATLCYVNAPACLLCPVQLFCKAYHAQSTAQVPAKKTAKLLKPVIHVLAIVQQGNQILVDKRPATGLMGGLWEFPNFEITKEADLKQQLHELLYQQWQLSVTVLQQLPTFKHRYTTFKATQHCYLCQYHSQTKSARQGQWLTLEELSQLSFSAPQAKLMEHLIENKILS
ncbi:A/G-specific adenine glycosylase [Deltaproteobacteria bacterium TL4]